MQQIFFILIRNSISNNTKMEPHGLQTFSLVWSMIQSEKRRKELRIFCSVYYINALQLQYRLRYFQRNSVDGKKMTNRNNEKNIWLELFGNFLDSRRCLSPWNYWNGGAKIGYLSFLFVSELKRRKQNHAQILWRLFLLFNVIVFKS